MRLYANKQFSYSLSDHAIIPYRLVNKKKEAAGKQIECLTEQEIFAALYLPYVKPEDRITFDPPS